MQLALLAARLLLAATFSLAGVSKLADRKGASKALGDFGLPAALARPFSLLLSLAEIAIAVALVPTALAWYGACAALALLAAFVIAIVVNLARGRSPDCHCFGQLHSAPVGRSTLVRNGVLGGLAAWLVWRGPLRDGPSLWQHLSVAGGNERRLFLVAAAILAVLFFRALRRRDEEEPAQEAEDPESEDLAVEDDDPAPEDQPAPRPRSAPKMPTRSPELEAVLLAGTGWPIGTPAPKFTLPDLTGRNCSLDLLRGRGRPILLVFSSPHCESCRALWPYLGRWARENDPTLNLIVISRGAATEKLAKQGQLEPSRVVLQQEFELSDAYGVTATPAAVLVGQDGLIQSQLAVGRLDISKLIVSSTKNTTKPAGVEPHAGINT